MTVYDTVGFTETEKKAIASAQASQEDRILEYLATYPEVGFTPFQILRDVFMDRIPVTSVRRALTDLTKAGLLTKMGPDKIERHGARNHAWAYVPSTPETAYPLFEREEKQDEIT